MAVKLNNEDVRAALVSKFGGDLALESFKQLSLMEDGRLGFLGDHFKVEAVVRIPASAPEARAVSLFVKSLPLNAQARATVLGAGAFKKESLFYKLLAKDLTEAVGGARDPECQPFVFPQCHLIKEDCMLLDDLGKHGFATIEARDGLGIEHVRLVVKALGELHAGSIVLEERRGRSLAEQYPDLNFETFFSTDPKHPNATWHKASVNLCVGIVPHLDKYRGLDKDTLARVQAALPQLVAELFDNLGTWPGTRNVMSHGDVWVNNFMFRSDAEGRPVEVSLVDFQLARFSPPANDLVMFLAFCVTRELQQKHWDELKRLHWDSLAATLRKAGCDPDKLLPWTEFDSTAEKMRKYGLVLMALEHPFALAPGSFMDPLLEDPDKFHHHCHVDRTNAVIGLYKSDAIFHSRYNETMEGLIDGYILNQPT